MLEYVEKIWLKEVGHIVALRKMKDGMVQLDHLSCF